MYFGQPPSMQTIKGSRTASMNWYQLPAEEVLEKLGSSHNGLTEAEAERRLVEFGRNKLAEEERISRIRIIIHQFTSPLIYILMLAAGVAFVLREFIDAGVIVAVLVLNALIGYLQEYKAEESVRALRKMVVPRAKLLRGGREREIDSEELVPGDVVILASGAKIPADVRLFREYELRIDESMLTGESIPAEKTTSPLAEEKLTFGDQKNMAFMGTVVASGRAKGAVVATGSNTALGEISREVKTAGVVSAPIQGRIDAFAKKIGILVMVASGGLFSIGLAMGEDASDMFMTAVAAAVATVPEGLPIVVTIAMAVGVARMARRNAIVRKLPAVETLGSTTVIGSDKTGTLTKNEMTVRLVYDGKHICEVTGTGYEPAGEVLCEDLPVEPSQLEELRMIFRIGLLCNESDVFEEEGRYHIEGDPTEGALIVAAMKAGLRPEEERDRYSRLAIVPFESERGYMATLNEHEGKRFIFVKGSTERILDMCLEGCRPEGKKLMDVSARFAHEGLRVLALAYKEVSPGTDEITHEELQSGLILAGLQGMIDPPREESKAAVETCRKAGIRTIMITGDHAVTARVIAKRVGIIADHEEVLTGKELEAMPDEDLFDRLKGISVFARVSPEHKLRIVNQLKKGGEIVALTGDGVNDAPALKAAHIGIAMGRGGTDVAREASDMIITDDNFATIVNAVEEGRVVFDNIRKVVFFLIPTGIAAVISILGALLWGLPIPYVAAQLLWINLVTNGLQDVALAFEPGERNILERPPRSPKEGIMSRILIQRTILVGILISLGVVYNYFRTIRAGAPLEEARTVAVTTMVFFQFFQAWNARSEIQSIFRISLVSNPFLFFSMIAAFFAHLAVLYVPAFQWVFRTVPLTAGEWLSTMIVALTVVVVVEIDKWIRRQTPSPPEVYEWRETEAGI